MSMLFFIVPFFKTYNMHGIKWLERRYLDKSNHISPPCALVMGHVVYANNNSIKCENKNISKITPNSIAGWFPKAKRTIPKSAKRRKEV